MLDGSERPEKELIASFVDRIAQLTFPSCAIVR